MTVSPVEVKMRIVLSIFLMIGLFFSVDRSAEGREGQGRLRVVSFSPAVTDIVFRLGGGRLLVGVSDYCRLPQGVSLPRLGSLFGFNLDKIVKLRPNLLLIQSNPRKFEPLKQLLPGLKIEHFQIETLEHIARATVRVGRLLGLEERASEEVREFWRRLAEVRSKASFLPKTPKVLFLMGTQRPVVAGPGTFIEELIDYAGGRSVGGMIPGNQRWRPTQIENILETGAEILLVYASNSADLEKVRAYWRQWKGLPASESGRIFVTSDRLWLSPSLHLPRYGDFLVKIFSRGERNSPVSNGPSEGEGTGGEKLSLFLVQLLRILGAFAVGLALGGGGMALQGLLRNPLAEPYILGISSGAGVGVLSGLAFAASFSLPFWGVLPLWSFLGASLSGVIVYFLSRRAGVIDPYTLILAGIVVNSLNGALMLSLYLFLDPYQIADFAYWSMGRLPDVVDENLLIIGGGTIAAGWSVLILWGPQLNISTLGDDLAESMGVSVKKLRVLVLVAVGLMTGAAVSIAGPIAFLGLIAPHISRALVGADLRRGVVLSGIVGGIILSLGELFCRKLSGLLNVGAVPVGLLTALLGAPFFLYLLRRKNIIELSD